MRTLWLVVPDHVMTEAGGFTGRIDLVRASKLYVTKEDALVAAYQQHDDQRWPVHVLEASVIQVFPAEQEAAE